MFVKLSILLHYTRISVMAFERRLCYVLIGILLSGYVAVIILSMLRCIPFQALWVPNIAGAKCLDTTKLFLAVQSHTLAMDFIILLAPLFILRHLTLPWTQRLLLVIVVGFGGMYVYPPCAFLFFSCPRESDMGSWLTRITYRACIASVIRLQVLRLSTTSTDRTWDSYFSAIYGAIECNLGIVCACIVTLRPMFRRWRWFSGAAGEVETSKVELELPRVRRNVNDNDDDDVQTIGGGTFVRGASNDLEYGAGDNTKVAGRTDSKRELIRVTSLTVDKDESYAGSTVVGSGSSGGRQDSDTKGSFTK